MELQECQEIRQEKNQNDIDKNLISHFSKDMKSDVISLKFNCRLPQSNLAMKQLQP